MSTALLIGPVLVAALACPAMMWFQARRGKSAPCCPPRPAPGEQPQELDTLRAEHARLSAQLAELETHSKDRAPAAPRL